MQNQVFEFLLQITILIFSVVIHEVSHGAAAYAMGDSTAKDAGRLTLNPLKHLDPFGSVILPVITYLTGGFIFGWARPVPYNPYYLRNQKYGPALVGAAGPLSNVLVALVFGLIIRFLGPDLSLALSPAFLRIVVFIVFLNLVLAIFNLVPIPPLDGSKVLFALLPARAQNLQIFFEQYGILLLLLLYLIQVFVELL